jgi:FAD/FMN-containing dehydrogenase/Fe-S oxidoreductase
MDDAAGSLRAGLAATVRGDVRFDVAHRAMYSADASNYRRVPIGVVAPRDADDVAAALSVCREHGVPVLPVGARTSIAGNAVNTAVVLDFARHMTRIAGIDADARLARVQPGVVLDDLRAAARPHGLTFGPDPSTHDRCTLGGMIGNNACGSHSVAWGKTVDNVDRLDVLTYRGERLTLGPGRPSGTPLAEGLRDLVERHAPVIRSGFPELTRRVSGYNLPSLLPEAGFDTAAAFVGTEGTCGTLVEATVRLVDSPPARALVVLGFPDAYLAADHAPLVRTLGALTIEGMDAGLVAASRARNPLGTGHRALPAGGGWLYVETGGDTAAQARAAAEAIAAALKPEGATAAVLTERAAMAALWRIREDGAGSVTRDPGGGEAWPGWEDAAVPPRRFGAYLRDFDALLAQHRRRGVYYGHFGDGCLHVRIDFDLVTDAGVAGFRSFVEDAADLVVSYGGSLSGEHGDGAARAELLPRMFPPDVIDAFGEFKAVWDPDGMMNPDRLVRPARLDADLRVRTPLTIVDRPVLAFAHDGGSFGTAARRCLGVGRCVTAAGGVMCPSYRATAEEMHSTRGRARLLFEMATGTVPGGWRSEEVAEALDLCLGCKGCKRDCPVGVDMAAYKTEFLARRYRRKRRPATHYSMGALPRWVRLLRALPRGAVGAFNAVSGSRLAKRLAGITPERSVPPVARRSYRSSHVDGPGERRVLLWPDTFTDNFDPGIAAAAVAVLERLGYAVEIPGRTVCCGLTWTSTGQVDAARRVLRGSLRTVQPWLDAGVPVVALEPSCAAALRSDLAEVLPGNPLAEQLSASVRTFAEVLADHTGELSTLASGDRRAIVQQHCHQHAELGFSADTAVLAALGVQADVLDSGCCGLAGNFGFERGHYEVSMACAERVLLPAVRAADADTAVLADGFSCRTQLRHATSREPMHLAQLAAAALGLSNPD